MPYIVEKIEDQLVDALSSPASWKERDRGYYTSMYDAIADMRTSHQEQGTTLKTPEWKRVASIQAPLEEAIRITKGEFLKDKKVFYSWLDRNPQYCTYDRRRGRRV